MKRCYEHHPKRVCHALHVHEHSSYRSNRSIDRVARTRTRGGTR